LNNDQNGFNSQGRTCTRKRWPKEKKCLMKAYIVEVTKPVFPIIGETEYVAPACFPPPINGVKMLRYKNPEKRRGVLM
jgi:hypothetical protein